MNRKNRSSGYIIYASILCCISSAYASQDSIRPLTLEDNEERRKIIKICLDNTNSPGKEFLDMRPGQILPLVEDYNKLRKNGSIDPILGFHGFYREENLIGFISVKFKFILSSQQHEYAECQMLIHPAFRGQGLGKLFLKKFNEEIVDPKVNKHLSIIIEDNYGKLVGLPHTYTFKGLKGYIHLDNLASQKLVTSVGYAPVDLCYKEYMGASRKSAQICYIYPPDKDNSYLSEEITEVIQRNSNTEKGEVIDAAISRQHDLDQEDFLTNKIKSIFRERQSEPMTFLKKLLNVLIDIPPNKNWNKTPEVWFDTYVDKFLIERRPELFELWKQIQADACMTGVGIFPLLEIKVMENEPGFQVEDLEIYELAVKYRDAKADFLPVNTQRKIAKELFSILEKRGTDEGTLENLLKSLSLSEK
ncbi:GNAT family N-acetyltransferase [Candidatus Paracaedibacter symbiosus]|uniref:GNAT family N-acetyltransferase n=1 Tax=Candidatus Paracaedibacter symbiosus TaxID=244582 RepID=UPI000509FEA7|nr:GNAT family N-acetyltransferase [Candidatus Paracaedibacter symbiosus]